MSVAFRIVGYFFAAIALLAGLWMWLIYLDTLSDWLGWLAGFIVAMVILPSLPLFPLVLWVVQGNFPYDYLFVWIVGVVCSAIAGFCLTRERG